MHVSQENTPPLFVVGLAGGYLGPTKEQRREHAERLLDEILTAAGVPESVTVTRTVLFSETAAKALVDRAAGAEMLAVGSRGLSGFQGLLLGSVSQQCVTHAHCPVVVVPTPEA